MKHRRHPDRLGAGAVLAQVVDEDAVGGRQADALGAEQEDLRLGLVHADLAGDDDGVEELVEHGLVVDVRADRVGDQAGADAGLACGADRIDHRRLRPDPRKDPGHQAVGVGHAQQRRQVGAELVGADLRRLELAQLGASLGARAQQIRERIRRQPLRLAERPERLEDVRRQHPTEVDQQAAELLLLFRH